MPTGPVSPESGEGQAKTPEVIKNEEDAKKGAQDFIVKEKAEKAERAKKGLPQTEEKRTASRESKEKADSKNRGEKQYFSEVPNEQKIIDQVNEFYADLAEKELSELDTRVLARHYLFLRKRSEETESGTSFLSILFNELFKRGLDPNRLYSDSVREPERPAGQGAQEQRKIPIPEGLLEDSPILGQLKYLDTVYREYGRYKAEDLQRVYDKINDYTIEGQMKQKAQALESILEVVEQELHVQHSQEEEIIWDRMRGWYGERKLRYEEKNRLKNEIKVIMQTYDETEKIKPTVWIEGFYNRVFERADSNPYEDFQTAMSAAGEKEYNDFLALLNEIRSETDDIAVRDIIAKLTVRYTSEHKLRTLLHNAYYIADSGGEAKQFADYCKQFSSEFVDLVFSNYPEVEVALRIREQVLYQIKRENNGRIPYEKVCSTPEKSQSEWENRTREMLRNANKKKLLISGEVIEDWRIDRALSISRGFGMVTLRFPEVVAECVVHAPPGANESQVSIPWETISWELNPLDHRIKRYKIAREMRGILYAAVTRKKGRFDFWSQDELKDAMAIDTIDSLASLDPNDEERMVDLRNLFKIGGPFTYSTWRSFTAALEEGNEPHFRKLLSRNPGLVSKLMWNREYENQAYFKKNYKKVHPNANNKEVLKAWEVDKGKTKEKRKTDNLDIKTLEGAIDRIPHVMLRIITDPTNKLLREDEINALLREIFDKDININSEEFTKVETALTLAKENLMKRRREKGEKFADTEDKLLDEDFAVIGDENMIRQARKFQKVLRKSFDKNKGLQERFIKKFDARTFAFALTTEDLPWNEFRFAQTGGRGFITRRINDWYQEVQANEAMIELLKQIPVYQSPEQIVAQLKKIFDFAEVHDYDRAQEAIGFLAKGIIRMYQMDGILKIPIFGEIMSAMNGIRHRGTSFAQTVYGGKAMSWDSDDILMFTEQLRAILIGESGYNIIEKLRTETGGTLWHSIGKKTKLAFYLLLLFGVYELSEKIVKEK
ncbi:MAG: hypothetical protein ABH816_01255 [Candidatus Levyibacteriota bacterium]